jgi:fructose-1,6-bisphosphatase
MSSRHRGSLKEIKSLKNWLREHCKQDYRTHSFVNYGWSYKSIATYLGISIAKAVEVIKYAVENQFITKKNNFMFMKLSHCAQIDYIQHTFSYHGYSYKVWANTYDMATGTI